MTKLWNYIWFKLKKGLTKIEKDECFIVQECFSLLCFLIIWSAFKKSCFLCASSFPLNLVPNFVYLKRYIEMKTFILIQKWSCVTFLPWTSSILLQKQKPKEYMQIQSRTSVEAFQSNNFPFNRYLKAYDQIVD